MTLPVEQVQEIRRLVGLGEAKSVSAFVQHAVGNAIADEAGWGAMLADALLATGGELTAAERAWADQVLSTVA